jgi:hypothetical protein
MTKKNTFLNALGVFTLSFQVIIFSQNAIVDASFGEPESIDSANSFSVDYTTNPGKLQLQSGENENLARNKFAYIVYTGIAPNRNGVTDTAVTNAQKLLDGNKSTFVSILDETTGQGGRGTYIVIDLQALRTVKKVVIFTGGGANPNLRPRAYSIFAGLDTLSLEKVFENPSNRDSITTALFDPVVAKYVMVVIDIIPAETFLTVISEIEVYGEGFLPEGEYVSSIRTVTKNVNFGALEFDADVPDGTNIIYNFRTGDSQEIDSTWSNWSDNVSTGGSLFNVYEPRKFIQYKVRLTTSNLFTPIIDEIRINYDIINVVSDANSFISPQYSPILAKTEFSLTVQANFDNTDHGIDSLMILTPTPVELMGVTVNGSPVSYLADVKADKITIVFTTTIKTNSTIVVRFTATPFLAVNPFITRISSKNVLNNYQQVNSKAENGVLAWSVVTTGVPDKLIIGAEANPNPFTPNNDGRNDVTKISFFIGNIGEPSQFLEKQFRRLTIKIYDLTGRLVRDLFEADTKSFAYISENSIEWDGRDNSGKLVRPGVYIYQLFINSDDGGDYVSKTIVVSY